MLTREDMNHIDKTIFGKADNIYVKKTDCVDLQKDTQKKFSNDNTRIELIMQTINFFKKLGWILVSATCGQCAIMIFDLLKG